MKLDLLKLYFSQHWINHTETIQTIPLGSVEQENEKMLSMKCETEMHRLGGDTPA
jgi:hypothetical protein